MKSWHLLAMNPQTVESLYSTPPSLNNVILHELTLKRDGWDIQLRFDLTSFPDRPPAKWKSQQFNQAQVIFQFGEIKNLEIIGWSRGDDPITIQLSGLSRGSLAVSGKGAHCQFRFNADSFRVDGVSAYRKGDAPVDVASNR